MEFPANSNTEKKEPAKKEIKQIVTGEVVRKKRSLTKRFTETFIGGDVHSVWSYVAFDVLLPAAKDMVSDAVSQGVEKILFGESTKSPSRRGRQSTPNGYVSYNKYSPLNNGRGSMSRDRDEERPISRRGRATHNFDEIILATRAEAEEVIDRMFDLVSRYEVVTVAELYSILGVTGEFTDEKYGWTDIRGAGVTRIRSGFLLDLPKPEPLD